MDFSQNLCNIMKVHGISKAKLARQLGVSPSTITNWLEGRCKPGIEKMREMCKFFQVTADYLLTGRTEPADYSAETTHSLTPQSFSMAETGNGAKPQLTANEIYSIKEMVQKYEEDKK